MAAPEEKVCALIDAPFALYADSSKRLLEIVLRGQWTVETVLAYTRAREKVFRKLERVGIPPGHLRILVDAHEMSAQSQDAVNMFRHSIATSRLHPGRSALVLSSALLKMQINRISMPGQRVFADKWEAQAWLFAPERQDAISDDDNSSI